MRIGIKIQLTVVAVWLYQSVRLLHSDFYKMHTIYIVSV